MSLSYCVFWFHCLLSRVACHQLGYITGDYVGDFLESENASLSAANAPLFHVNCTGSEGNLQECSRPLEIPEEKQNYTLLHVNCSLDSGIGTNFGIRLFLFSDWQIDIGVWMYLGGRLTGSNPLKWMICCYKSLKLGKYDQVQCNLPSLHKLFLSMALLTIHKNMSKINGKPFQTALQNFCLVMSLLQVMMKLMMMISSSDVIQSSDDTDKICW